jgi:hypothetical protein
MRSSLLASTSLQDPSTFGYTGTVQTFTADVTGLWAIEAFGAQGGSTAGFLG